MLPAFAVGARFTFFTVIVTSSVSEPPWLSRTVSRNVRAVLAVTSGAVNVGDATLELLSVTLGPARWLHEYLRGSPSGSLPEPASVTVVRSFTIRLFPASAVGSRFTFLTVTVTWSVSLSDPSLTVSSNRISESAVTSGVKYGVAVVAPCSVTDGPEIRRQRYVSWSRSGSELPVPSRSTRVRSSTVWSSPASASGGRFTFRTVTVTWSVSLSGPSLTLSSNV